MAQNIKNWVVKNNIACCLIPKNGSTSFRNALKTSETYTSEEIVNLAPVRVAWIRDPWLRWQSCYSFFYYLNETNQQSNNPSVQVPMSATHNGYEAFVDYALANQNAHWHPQTILIQSAYTVAHRFEDVSKLWGNYWPGFLPWYNALTDHLPINNYKEDEINAKYADDIVLYNSLEVAE